VWVDIPDAPESRHFFTDLKAKLKEQYRQIDIWMIAYAIDVL
jgi:hypothetical protein